MCESWWVLLLLSFSKSWQVLASVGKLWQVLASLDKLWQVLASCGKSWQVVASLGVSYPTLLITQSSPIVKTWQTTLILQLLRIVWLVRPCWRWRSKIPFDYDWFCPLKTMAFINLKALPSANTFHCFLREKTVYFSDEVFSLRFRGYFKQQC